MRSWLLLDNGVGRKCKRLRTGMGFLGGVGESFLKLAVIVAQL